MPKMPYTPRTNATRNSTIAVSGIYTSKLHGFSDEWSQGESKHGLATGKLAKTFSGLSRADPHDTH